jgi:hypothetical protein
MATISRARVEAFVEAGANGEPTADQGRALEELICYVFAQVPGISITRRTELNAFETEEIDRRAVERRASRRVFLPAKHHPRRVQELVEPGSEHGAKLVRHEAEESRTRLRGCSWLRTG